jgi:hypothetical protein
MGRQSRRLQILKRETDSADFRPGQLRGFCEDCDFQTITQGPSDQLVQMGGHTSDAAGPEVDELPMVLQEFSHSFGLLSS